MPVKMEFVELKTTSLVLWKFVQYKIVTVSDSPIQIPLTLNISGDGREDTKSPKDEVFQFPVKLNTDKPLTRNIGTLLRETFNKK